MAEDEGIGSALARWLGLQRLGEGAKRLSRLLEDDVKSDEDAAAVAEALEYVKEQARRKRGR